MCGPNGTVDQYVAEVLSAKKWIKEQLITHNSSFHLDGGNYFLIWPNKKSSEVAASLKKSGILVRLMSKKPLIDNSIRVSIGTKSQMKLFWNAYIESESS